jgi:predicted peroxiredoxin
MSMQPALVIVVAEARDERFWSALQAALAARSAGAGVGLFLSGDAVRMGLRDWHAPGDSKRSAYCVDTVAELLERAAARGIRFHACRAGLHLLEESEDALSLLFAPATLEALMQHLPSAQLLAF